MSIEVDPKLAQEIAQLTGCASEQSAVIKVLEDYIRRKRALPPSPSDPEEALKMLGTVDFDPAWDYKEARRRDMERIPQDGDR